MILSEKYKSRIKKLAGLITEDIHTFSQAERDKAYENFGQRVPFSKDLMAKAIREGWEVGIVFQSNNSKYKMPTPKARIIYPVAMGTNPNGNYLVRAFHKLGQSEGAARNQETIFKSGKGGTKNYRSTEVKNEWRLFKVSNIKSMWLTGEFFDINDLSLYNETKKDKAFVPELMGKRSEWKKFRTEYNKQREEEKKEPLPTNILQKPSGKVAKEPEQPKGKTKPVKAVAKEPLKPVKPVSTGKTKSDQQK